MTTGFENRTRRQAEINHFWAWATRLYPKEQVQSVLQPEISTSGLNANVSNLNNTASMRKKNVPENVTKLTNLWFKCTKEFVDIKGEMNSTEWNKSLYPKNTIVCNGKTPAHFLVQLYRQNDQSDNFKVFSSFESSIKAFDNFSGTLVFS